MSSAEYRKLFRVYSEDFFRNKILLPTLSASHKHGFQLQILEAIIGVLITMILVYDSVGCLKVYDFVHMNSCTVSCVLSISLNILASENNMVHWRQLMHFISLYPLLNVSGCLINESMTKYT
jgi:hypothetical protein